MRRSINATCVVREDATFLIFSKMQYSLKGHTAKKLHNMKAEK
jgi:hypothetical protein